MSHANKLLCCVKNKQDVNFFLVDLRLHGCLATSPSREVLASCSARLNRAHPGLVFVYMYMVHMTPAW